MAETGATFAGTAPGSLTSSKRKAPQQGLLSSDLASLGRDRSKEETELPTIEGASA